MYEKPEKPRVEGRGTEGLWIAVYKMCPVRISRSQMMSPTSERTVKRPREIVPTNLVILIGQGIFSLMLLHGVRAHKRGSQLSLAD